MWYNGGMQEFERQLREAVKEVYGVDFEVEVTPAPGNVEADFSSNVALKLVKELRTQAMASADGAKNDAENDEKNDQKGQNVPTLTPMAIAEKLAEKIPNVTVTAPGFINYISPDEYLKEKIGGFADDFEKNISSDEYSGQTVICEFSDPNPFKVLHVGHLYTSVVGDAISRLYEAAGARVVRANFGGDVGLHVAKTMYALRQKPIDDLTIEDIAKCYVEGTAAYEDSEEAHAEITRLNKEIYKINAEEIHGTALADLYWRGRELSYEYFKDFYATIGVKFDKFYPESIVAERGLAKVREELAKGVYEESDGAVVFDGEKYGLHTRVFINKEGIPTYEAKDVGLIFQKYADYKFDESVVITGNEQKDYMQVVLKSVEQYAPELVERTTHLTHGLVKLKGGVKMSSRKGNFLKAVEVLEMVQEALAAEYGSRDEKVMLAATKYAFLKYKMGGDIIFDPAESVKMTGNSGPYLLYSAVRAKKILKNGEGGAGRVGEFVSELNGFERKLVQKVIWYPEVLNEARAEQAPHKLANYLYELAQEFSRFYENCPVVGAAEEAGRLTLVQGYLNVMTHGLGLLGIEIPEEM